MLNNYKAALFLGVGDLDVVLALLAVLSLPWEGTT